MFGLGLEPTGSKDPFALRRAANGIVKILAETEVVLLLSDLVGWATAYSNATEVGENMRTFLGERLGFYLREVKGNAYDVVNAVLATGFNDVRDAVARAEAVTAVRGSEDFAAVSAAFKRIKNILAQAREKGDLPEQDAPEASFAHPAEIALNTQAGVVGERVKKLADQRDYLTALEAIATLRPQVDTFFKDVMVMDPDKNVRLRRLVMLQRIVRTFSGIADFSEIVVAG